MGHAFGIEFKNSLPSLGSEDFLLCFLVKFLYFVFKSVIHFEITFVYSVSVYV